jgi:hypothetical protein
MKREPGVQGDESYVNAMAGTKIRKRTRLAIPDCVVENY